MRKSIGIAALVITVVMLVSVPSAIAGEPIEVLGIVAFENGTWVPDDWPGWSKNVNRTYNPAPFVTEVNPFLGNIYVTDQYDSFDDYLRVNCTSPDGRWFGENTRRIEDAWDPGPEWFAINVTVYEKPTEIYTKNLKAGWNLVSLPLTPGDNSVSAVLGSIQYDAVKKYTPGTGYEDATTMDPGVGYFINMTAEDTWTYEGTAYPFITTQLEQGLNMVGWVNETDSALPGVLDSIAGNYSYVARWDATAQSYEVFVPNLPSEFNDFGTLNRGEGYFIAAKGSCTLTYPTYP